MKKRVFTRPHLLNLSALYLSAEVPCSAPPDLIKIKPLSEVQPVLHETTQTLMRERLQPRRVAIRALRLYKEWEGAVEVVLDEQHCVQPLLARMGSSATCSTQNTGGKPP